MQGIRNRPRPRLLIPDIKPVDVTQSPCISGGTLTPDLPHSPPVFPTTGDETEKTLDALKIQNYVLLNLLDSHGQTKVYRAFHTDTHEEFVCKVVPVETYRDCLTAYTRVGSHPNINPLVDVIVAKTRAYFVCEPHYGDLHSYVRTRKRLREAEASRLFAQITAAVCHCHENGVVLRDFKLRKFVFKDADRTELKLLGLEDVHLCSDDDDVDDALSEKHGCPAYVSPEILLPNKSYSGRRADVWSLGVMLYTMLVGRYPFHDRQPGALFLKIRRGEFFLPDTMSSRAKCLVRNLLRHEPEERLASADIHRHPWFSPRARNYVNYRTDSKPHQDQTVPEFSPPLDTSPSKLPVEDCV